MTSAESPIIDHGAAQALLVGPESACWRYASDARLYLVMLYPLLLQVAHPTVAAGVRDFSDFDERPWERLLRTLDYVSLLVYGGPDAIAAGRRLRALHKGFRGQRADGQRYYALEPRAYAWVHATLLHTYVAGHRHFGQPMTPTEVESFYREYRGLGRLIGIRPHDLPDSWPEFCAYFAEVSRAELVPNETVDRVLRAVELSGPPVVPIPGPLWRAVRIPARRATWIGGVGLMAPELRGRLDVPWTQRDERAFQNLGRLTRAMSPAMPQRLRILGPTHLGLRRRAIARGPLGDTAES
ncbi:MAG: oxygenase MpaB family protein [Solirubrobacteraceae bacterium]